MNDRDLRDEYLWTGRGAPDPEIARLERALAPLAHKGTLPALPRRASKRTMFGVLLPLATAAASLTLVIAAAWYARGLTASSWTVKALGGAPTVAGTKVQGTGQLPIGAWIVTDDQSRAQLEVGDIGRVEVEPNTRVRLVESRLAEHRMALERGRITAQIWAPPRLFYVNTPAATAVDLGCAYTLDVDERGYGTVHVLHGWVGFEYRGHESFIPQGAICRTRPNFGPGTPHFTDAPEGYEDALAALDFTSEADAGRSAALASVLDRARPRDALTLWHLLSRGTPEERVRVYDRMAALVPPPKAATRDAILRGDRHALDAWWDELGLDSASWWRQWKAAWPR
jgi:hypothetical protein